MGDFAGGLIGLVAVILIFGGPVALVLVPKYLKSRDQQRMQDVLRHSIDQGQPLPQEVIDALTRNVNVGPTALSDLRTGMIWVAIGLGVGVFGYFLSYEWDEALHVLGGVAALPTIIGAAFVILSFFNPNKGKQS